MSEFAYKQVIIIRTDLKMSKGKLAAQAGHAAVSAAEEARKKRPEWWEAWLEEGQCKIAVKAKSEEELQKLMQKNQDSTSALCAHLRQRFNRVAAKHNYMRWNRSSTFKSS